jgi:endonuclease/exonuclease/phosphatase family metal-dependent hydrolase
MRFVPVVSSVARIVVVAAALLVLNSAQAQSNVTVRVMAANLNGNTQSYQPFAIRIFQGLQPDVVAIQEFNYTSTNGVNVNNVAAFREMVDTAFGTNYVYYREPFTGSGDIPNGVISRYPIIASGSWTDTVQTQPNRGFAWAQIDLPGTNDLYIVSVHLLTSSSANRAAEANNLKALMQANFPANAWIVVAGDFNAGTRTEACVTTWNGYLTDFPIPVDKNGDSDTSANRNSPHDYVLPSLTFTNFETTTVYGPLSYPSGLVFDSRVYTTDELTNFSPVQSADSGLAQHMGVIKNFTFSTGNMATTNPPAIITQPQGQTNAVGSTISFNVAATGSGTLAYQWCFGGTNISGATANPFVIANAQLTNSGNYTVVITNLYGSITSSVAALLLTNAPPAITSQPQPQAVLAGQSATFNVAASGTPPLTYQWLLAGAAISGATTNPFVLPNVQSTDAGNYSVIVSNFAGSVTSSPAALTIVITNPAVFAQWNFNSVPADGSTSTGTTAPSVGAGMASLVGGTTATFATGDTVFDPAGTTDNTGWNLTGFPASGSNKTAGPQFAVSTAGRQNISISYSLRSSNTGGKYFRLQYSTNSGSAFIDCATAVTLPLGTTFYAFTNNLAGLLGVNNNVGFIFRIVAEFESTATGAGSVGYVAANSGSTYSGSSGTTRFDMVTVSGTPIITGTAAALTPISFSGGVFSLGVTGTVTASYVVQTSTNLGSTNWLPVFTNASPFTYSESNLVGSQKFYRTVAQ